MTTIDDEERRDDEMSIDRCTVCERIERVSPCAGLLVCGFCRTQGAANPALERHSERRVSP